MNSVDILSPRLNNVFLYDFHSIDTLEYFINVLYLTDFAKSRKISIEFVLNCKICSVY